MIICGGVRIYLLKKYFIVCTICLTISERKNVYRVSKLINWYLAINKGIGSLEFFFTRRELSFLFYVHLLQKKTMFR